MSTGPNQQIMVFLKLVQSGEIAIPEIQRPFVWDSTVDVRYKQGGFLQWDASPR